MGKEKSIEKTLMLGKSVGNRKLSCRRQAARLCQWNTWAYYNFREKAINKQSWQNKVHHIMRMTEQNYCIKILHDSFLKNADTAMP